MIRRQLGALLLAMTIPLSAAQSEVRHRLLSWDDLDGWMSDAHGEALNVFKQTCSALPGASWDTLCVLGRQASDAKAFFELFFRPVLVDDGKTALFTGYFEPELKGSLVPDDRFRYPLYAAPPELEPQQVWFSRAAIETEGLLEGRGLEIAWLADPVDLFFLQIQGSGRIVLADGSQIRVGYGGRNGHEYRSIGLELVRRGALEEHEVSAAAIRHWVREHPAEGRALLHHNPSYVFFRKVKHVDPSDGPLGAMNEVITPMRTIAVDPDFVPLGAPVWIEKDGARPLRRLMVAQDTGSAIKGAQRADIFFGPGAAAGEAAGTTRDPGRMVVLLPNRLALRMTGSE